MDLTKHTLEARTRIPTHVFHDMDLAHAEHIIRRDLVRSLAEGIEACMPSSSIVERSTNADGFDPYRNHYREYSQRVIVMTPEDFRKVLNDAAEGKARELLRQAASL